MTLMRRMAEQALWEHPDQSAIVVERLGEAETVSLLDRENGESAAAIVRRLSPHYATAVLQGMSPDRASRLLDALPIDAAARLTRRVEPQLREQILGHMRPGRGRSLRAVLSYPEGSAGALMDPDVLALPEGLRVREALQRVRKIPALARYNVYVLADGQRLVGALNLRELFLAEGRAELRDLMVRDPHRILATADRMSVLAHGGWKEVHQIPVVDDAEAYLGAIRYRTLRELEEDLLAMRKEHTDAGLAFGELIAASARGILEAFSGPAVADLERE